MTKLPSRRHNNNGNTFNCRPTTTTYKNKNELIHDSLAVFRFWILWHKQSRQRVLFYIAFATKHIENFHPVRFVTVFVISNHYLYTQRKQDLFRNLQTSTCTSENQSTKLSTNETLSSYFLSEYYYIHTLYRVGVHITLSFDASVYETCLRDLTLSHLW